MCLLPEDAKHSLGERDSGASASAFGQAAALSGNIDAADGPFVYTTQQRESLLSTNTGRPCGLSLATRAHATVTILPAIVLPPRVPSCNGDQSLQSHLHSAVLPHTGMLSSVNDGPGNEPSAQDFAQVHLADLQA